MLGYITPNVSEFNTQTYIGCTSDFEARFHEHNSNGGGWIPIMLLEFPSTFSTDAVQIICDNWKKKTTLPAEFDTDSKQYATATCAPTFRISKWDS